MSYDVQRCRADFPSMTRVGGGYPAAYLDGPGGTQTPRPVIDAMVRYYETCNANSGGRSATCVETDREIARARAAMAAMLGAASPNCISFGANMTSLGFPLSRGLARLIQPGDEVVLTNLDHEANRGPWLTLAEQGAAIKSVNMTPEGRLDMAELKAAITPRTKIVAVGYSSNSLGTVNDLPAIREWSRAAGAWLIVDAVHGAPHFPIDVGALDPDFLLCSAYKFYGPHIGILYTRPGLLELIPHDKLRCQKNEAPYRIETGTLNHAALCGVTAAVEYIASFGTGKTLREQVVSGIARIHEHEMSVARHLYDGLKAIKGVTVYGPSFDGGMRAPTVSFRVEGVHPADVSQYLSDHGIYVSNGSFYAVGVVEYYGLVESGGLVRIGISLYNTVEEIDRVLACLRELAGK